MVFLINSLLRPHALREIETVQLLRLCKDFRAVELFDVGALRSIQLSEGAVARVGLTHDLSILISLQGCFQVELDARITWLGRLVLEDVRDACQQPSVFFVNLLQSFLRMRFRRASFVRATHKSPLSTGESNLLALGFD